MGNKILTPKDDNPNAGYDELMANYRAKEYPIPRSFAERASITYLIVLGLMVMASLLSGANPWGSILIDVVIAIIPTLVILFVLMLADH